MIAHLSSLPLPALARGIANHLWQSTAFAVVAGFIILLLQKHGARIRYWVWMAASVKFLLPFSLLMFIGSHLAVPATTFEPATRAYVALDRMSQPFVGDQAFTMPATQEQTRTEDHPSSTQLFLQLAAAAWLCGFMGIAGYWIVQWRRLRRIVNTATPLLEGREYALFRKVQQSLGVSRDIGLLASEDWTEPGIVGVFHRVLLWPEGVSEHLEDSHLETIFAHELCHVDRHDNLTALIHMAVESIFWFHPLVWWMGRQIVTEREQACDEHVVLSGKDPEVYAESILRICKFCLSAPLPCVSGVSGADLKKRVVLIMKADIVSKLGSLGKSLLCATAAIILALPLFLGRAAGAYSAKGTTALEVTAGADYAPKPKDSLQQAGPEMEATMAANARPVFEVASIKPSKPDDDNSGFQTQGRTLFIENESINDLIMFAYGVHPKQILQGQPWMESEHFDIKGLANMPGVPSWIQYQEMVRQLLVDRFQLKFHREKKELSVYAVAVAKTGTKMDKSTHPNGLADESSNGNFNWRFTNCTMADFASTMQSMLDRPVVDQTGLKDKYDFRLRWTPENRPSPDPNAPPGLFTAVQEQLGLKFEPTKALTDALIVEHVAKPSEN